MTGKQPIGSKWIDINKGDAKAPNYRSRLVAKEIKRGPSDNMFAATPPLEAKKCLFSTYARESRRNNEPRKLSFVDVKKAYFNGTPTRNIYMAPPRDIGLPKSLLVKQTKCEYGTRNAGMIWEETYRATLDSKQVEHHHDVLFIETEACTWWSMAMT